jgi:hypothetical protein
LAQATAPLALALGALACAATSTHAASPLRVPREPLALRLDDPAAWRQLEVRRRSFARTLVFSETASGRTWQVDSKGRPTSWMSPVNVIVPPRAYERRSHRGRYRFPHPLTGEPLVLRARATSQSAGTVPLPPASGPEVEVLVGDDERAHGHLAYDQHSLVLFAGELGGRAVEVEQLGAGVRRSRGPLEVLVAAFPLAGEFAVRIDGLEVARFVKQPQKGTVTDYELALRNDVEPALAEDAMVAFTVFAFVEELVEASFG